jgi:hypothetical protein
MIYWYGNLCKYRKIVYKRYMGLPLDIHQYTDMFGDKIEITIFLN